MITKPIKLKSSLPGIQKVTAKTKKVALTKALQNVRKTLEEIHLIAHDAMTRKPT